MKNYFSLHTHTIKSIGDAILKIDDYIEKAKSLNLNALAITNHGTMSDVFEFYKKCKKENITPIIGCEVYVTYDEYDKNSYDHLVLIAKNKKGFENLLMIHNDAQINGFYRRPRTNPSVLAEYGEGIIALSACVGGTIPKKVLDIYRTDANNEEEIENKYEELRNTIEFFNNVFDDFYFELQPGEFEEQIMVNQALVDLAQEFNIKTIITNDVHYLNREDYIPHNVHVCASRKQEVSDNILYPDTCYYVMTNDEIRDSLKNFISEEVIEESLNNIYKVVEQIEDYDLIPDKIYMPHFDVPEGYNEDTYLEQICFDRLEEIKDKIDDIAEYTERLLYELSVIFKLGFSGYFLTVKDYVMWAKNQNIQVGPGRGSVCGLA